MYAAPKAHIHLPGALSDPFPLLKETRQGCPLSPLLFIIAMEPLTCKLIESQEMRGVTVGGGGETEIGKCLPTTFCYSRNTLGKIYDL